MKFLENERNWYFTVGITLICLSVAIYSIQLLLFRQPSETYFYMLQDLAFVPVQILIVTIVIDRLLKRHEIKLMSKKIFVGIGLFFSETGNNLLKLLLAITESPEVLSERLRITSDWSQKNFNETEDFFRNFRITIRHESSVLDEMKQFLNNNRKFLLEMLENANLSEHEIFTDLLLAISHLADELRMRDDLASLPQSDINHLTNDITRVYKTLLNEWILYLSHIKINYPFLFSLAIRSNPFNTEDSVIIYEN